MVLLNVAKRLGTALLFLVLVFLTYSCVGIVLVLLPLVPTMQGVELLSVGVPSTVALLSGYFAIRLLFKWFGIIKPKEPLQTLVLGRPIMTEYKSR